MKLELDHLIEFCSSGEFADSRDFLTNINRIGTKAYASNGALCVVIEGLEDVKGDKLIQKSFESVVVAATNAELFTPLDNCEIPPEIQRDQWDQDWRSPDGSMLSKLHTYMFAFRGVVVQAPLLTVLSRLPEVRFPPVLKPDKVIQFVWAQGYGVLMPIRSGNQVFKVSAPWEA